MNRRASRARFAVALFCLAGPAGALAGGPGDTSPSAGLPARPLCVVMAATRACPGPDPACAGGVRLHAGQCFSRVARGKSATRLQVGKRTLWAPSPALACSGQALFERRVEAGPDAGVGDEAIAPTVLGSRLVSAEFVAVTADSLKPPERPRLAAAVVVLALADAAFSRALAGHDAALDAYLDCQRRQSAALEAEGVTDGPDACGPEPSPPEGLSDAIEGVVEVAQAIGDRDHQSGAVRAVCESLEDHWRLTRQADGLQALCAFGDAPGGEGGGGDGED